MSVSAKQKFNAAAKMAEACLTRALAMVRGEFGYEGWAAVRSVRRRASIAVGETRAAMKAIRLAAKCAAHLPDLDPIPEAPPRPEKKR